MTREDLHKAFTQDQINWLIKNGAKPEGNTDGEILANYAKLLWANRQWQGKDGAVTLNNIIKGKKTSYDLQSIAQAAGFADDPDKDGKKASEKFYDAYFGGEKDKDTRDRWRTGVYDAYGDGSWDKVRKVLQGESTNRMRAKIDKDRRDILEGNAEGQGWTDWGASALWGLVSPRTKKAVLDDREVTFGDIAGDILSNAAYAVPGSLIARPGMALASKVPGIASQVLGKGVQAGSQFVAPAAVYGVDKVLGNETDLYDPLLGGLANMGVNKVLGPAIGRAVAITGSKISTRLPKPLREALEGAKGPRERARETVEQARNTVKELTHPEKEYEDAFVNGLASTGKYERIGDAEKILNIAGTTDRLTPEVSAQLESARKFGNQVRELAKDRPGTAGDMAFEPEYWLAGKVAPIVHPNASAEGLTKWRKEYEKVLRSHPELMTLFQKEPLPSKADVVLAYAVNKYGGDQTGANVAAQALTGGKLDPKEVRKKQQEKRTKKRQASEAEQILKPRLEGLTGKDREYLQAIIDNPGLVQGYGNVTQDFRNWFLLRGQDLISGTKYFRPAPEVD